MSDERPETRLVGPQRAPETSAPAPAKGGPGKVGPETAPAADEAPDTTAPRIVEAADGDAAGTPGGAASDVVSPADDASTVRLVEAGDGPTVPLADDASTVRLVEAGDGPTVPLADDAPTVRLAEAGDGPTVAPVDDAPTAPPAQADGGLVGGEASGEARGGAVARPAWALRRVSSASVMIAVLLAGLGFTLVVQLRNVNDDPTLATARQEDLVRILSDLQAREQRLNADIAGLEDSKRQLASGVQGSRAALDEATRRADELGILAGTLPATGPGLMVRFRGNIDQIKPRTVLDAVQELRGAGAEAMQISGVDGAAVRVVASTYFLEGEGGINVDGKLLVAPYTIAVIGDPETMRTALNIPGGVVELVGQAGGTVTMNEAPAVEVAALRVSAALQYARPVP